MERREDYLGILMRVVHRTGRSMEGSKSALLLLFLASFHANGQFWQEVPIEAPDDVTPDGLFGAALDVDGDLLVVGAPGVDAGAPGSGSAYLYQRNAEGLQTWGFVQRILPPTPFTGGGFGSSVIFHGPYLFISAPRERIGGITRGAVHAYRFDAMGGAWEHEQRLSSEIAQWDLATGVELTGAEDLLLAHAPGFDPVPGDEALGCGALLTFRSDADGIFRSTRDIPGDQMVPGTSAQALQGWSAPCGNSLFYIGRDAKAYRLPLDAFRSDSDPMPTPVPLELGPPFHPQDPSFQIKNGTSEGNSIYLVVSEPLFPPPSPPEPGAYYACVHLECVGDEIVQHGYFVSDTADNDVIWDWGADAAAGAGRVIIGDPGDITFTPLGYAEVFGPDPSSATQWDRRGLLFPSDPEYGARFGSAVAVGEDFAVVGAPWKGDQDRGKVYGFVDPSVGIATTSVGPGLSIHPVPVRSGATSSTVKIDLPTVPGSLQLITTDGRFVGERSVSGPVVWEFAGAATGSYVFMWRSRDGSIRPRSSRLIVLP